MRGRVYPQYWIVNIPQQRVEVYREPIVSDKSTYRIREIYVGNNEIPLILDGIDFGRITPNQILPPTD